jgi:hypothetical protein
VFSIEYSLDIQTVGEETVQKYVSNYGEKVRKTDVYPDMYAKYRYEMDKS